MVLTDAQEHVLAIEAFRQWVSAQLTAMEADGVPADYAAKRTRWTLELRAMQAWHKAHCDG